MKRIQHIFLLLILFLSACGADQASKDQDFPLVRHEIRFSYRMPEAGEVFLVWGVDGWGTVAEAIRPAGTVLKDGLMQTPLAREGEWFTTRVQAPAGSTIEYGFLITKTSDGAQITPPFWEGNENFRFTATGEEVIEVETQISIGEAAKLPGQFSFLLYLLVGLGILGFAAFMLINLSLPTRFWQKLTGFAKGSS